MAPYNLIWKRSAEKELRKLHRDVIIRMLELAESLKDNPFPTGHKKLIIEIIRVGHRSDVYR
jgi:mRNA interferase RelE/StbE